MVHSVAQGRRLGLLLLLALLGCGEDEFPDRPQVFPAKGQLFVAGKPATGAVVRLHLLSEPPRQLGPHAVVAGDGAFELSTFASGDGAPPGEYALLIEWPAPPRPGKDDEGPDRFRRKYADAKKPVRRVQIANQPTDLGRIDLP